MIDYFYQYILHNRFLSAGHAIVFLIINERSCLMKCHSFPNWWICLILCVTYYSDRTFPCTSRHHEPNNNRYYIRPWTWSCPQPSIVRHCNGNLHVVPRDRLSFDLWHKFKCFVSDFVECFEYFMILDFISTLITWYNNNRYISYWSKIIINSSFWRNCCYHENKRR